MSVTETLNVGANANVNVAAGVQVRRVCASGCTVARLRPHPMPQLTSTKPIVMGAGSRLQLAADATVDVAGIAVESGTATIEG